MIRPVIKRCRQAVEVEGRCDSGQNLLTEHPSYLPPFQGHLSEEADWRGGRDGGDRMHT